MGKGLGWGCFSLIKGPQPSAETCPHVLHLPVSKDKQKKKKKQPCEFRSDPPIRSILGTRRVTLKTLLATEDLVATVCEFGILIPQKPPEPPVVEEKVRSMSQGQAASWGSV